MLNKPRHFPARRPLPFFALSILIANALLSITTTGTAYPPLSSSSSLFFSLSSDLFFSTERQQNTFLWNRTVKVGSTLLFIVAVWVRSGCLFWFKSLAFLMVHILKNLHELIEHTVGSPFSLDFLFNFSFPQFSFSSGRKSGGFAFFLFSSEGILDILIMIYVILSIYIYNFLK